MDIDESKIRIRFEYTNEYGDNFVSESTVKPWDSELMTMGEYFNTFLSQCGFSRKNDTLFMEDITEEEYDVLLGYLDEYRHRSEEEQ